MRVAIVSDVFPPKCGGSGWSSFYLAKALQERGHAVRVVVPRESQEWGEAERDYDGLPVTEFHYRAAHLPFVRNYTRNERLWPRFAAFLAEFFRRHNIEVAHGQHYLTIPPTVLAAQQTGAASLATVRDYWPVCYWTTHLSGERVCPGCSELNRLKCLWANQGAAGLAAAPASLYMGANLRQKQHYLAGADRVLAVSRYIATTLELFVPAERLAVVPNFVPTERLARLSLEPPATPGTDQPYLLYVGKFEENKGARLLLEMLRRARPAVPTLAVGEGSLRPLLERAAQAEGLDLRVLGWAENDEVLRLMSRATVHLFPSLWPEPLSRVLLEAQGVGALTLALSTGGTPDIITDGVNGVLAHSATEMASRLTELLHPAQADRRARMRAAAVQTAQTRFSREAVVGQVESLYEEALNTGL